MNVADTQRYWRISPPLKTQRGMQGSARVVAAGNLSLQGTQGSLIAAGLHRAGFSPMLGAPTGEGEMQPGDLELMLGEMIDCRRQVERASRSHFHRSLEPGTTGLGPAGAAHG